MRLNTVVLNADDSAYISFSNSKDKIYLLTLVVSDRSNFPFMTTIKSLV